MGTIPSAGTPHSVPTARSLRGDAELDKAEQPQAVADHNNNEGQVITKRCIKGKGKQDDVDITLVTLPAQPLPVTSIPLDELAPPTAPSQQPLDTNSATPTSLNVAPTPRPTRSKSVVLDVPPRPPLVHHLSDKSATTDHLPASSPGLPPLTASQSATAGGGAGNTSSSFNSGITTGMRSWKSSGRGNIDKKRLAALGFEEELTRDFDFWASFGLTLCNIGGFPGTTLAVLSATRTGGASMYSIAWPISGLFMLCLAAVLGEMASTWPVAGAMFTWTFRLCRSNRRLDPLARYFSWIVGSFLLFSHVLLQIVITWQFAHNLLGVIGLYTSRTYNLWVTVAICWAILAVSGVVVSLPISRSPWLWRCCGGLIVAFFLTVNIIMLTQAPVIRSIHFVFTDYQNSTGFTSKSYVYMLGWVLTTVASGMEASAHIAEDTKKPARTVPAAMFWSVAATYTMGWISICVLLATLDTGEEVSPTLRTVQPSIALIANSIPRRHTTLVLVCVLLSFLFQALAQLLATSRFTWALARESALPASSFLRKLSVRHKLPVRAVVAVCVLAAPCMLLLCVNVSILSTIFLEGAGVAVMFSYSAPVAIYLFCPRDALRGDGRAKWTLRQWSKPLGAAGVLFSVVFMIMLCLPTGYPVVAINASWASGILVFVLVASSISWIFYGNAQYAGPIRTTTRWTIGAEVELPRTSARTKTATAPLANGARGAGGANGDGGGGGEGAAATPFDETTSADHGRSAHVFSSFPTLMTDSGPPLSSGDDYESSGYGERSSWDEEMGERDSRWTTGSASRGTVDEGVRGRERSQNGSRSG